jgi:hypothetical protein
MVEEDDDLKTLSNEMVFKVYLGFGADDYFISTQEHSSKFSY